MARSVAAVLLALLLVPTAASAAKAPDRGPWATVNVCNTTKHPDAIGIRAAMPGDARSGVRLTMRFRVQWLDPADKKWHNLLSGGDSGFVSLGTGKAGRETGQIFRYQAPAPGKTQQLRGSVQFRWTRNGTVLRHTQRVTRAGHASAAGSDPKGYSAATCTLKG
jgi:hypothetical protein